jgi:hypothetical protein
VQLEAFGVVGGQRLRSDYVTREHQALLVCTARICTRNIAFSWSPNPYHLISATQKWLTSLNFRPRCKQERARTIAGRTALSGRTICGRTWPLIPRQSIFGWNYRWRIHTNILIIQTVIIYITGASLTKAWQSNVDYYFTGTRLKSKFIQHC